ncbi:Transposase [Herbaspirillum sp. YR522]|nr:Transposase [Herbaspirillum sp. YR522]
MKKRFADEQIIGILREAESREVATVELCRRHNITEQTFYRWRNKFGGMEVADARRLKDLESENGRLKRMVAEQLLVIDGLKEISQKNNNPNGPAQSAGSPDPKGAVAAKGMSLLGIESTGGDLQATAAGKRSRSGRKIDCGFTGSTALRISPDVSLADAWGGACSTAMERAEAKHTPQTTSSAPLWR